MEEISSNKTIYNSLKGGVLIEVTTEEEALIAQEAGASAIIIVDWNEEKNETGCFPDLFIVKQIVDSISIPIFIRVESGQLIEAQLVENMEVVGLDEVSNNNLFMYKRKYKKPIISGYTNFDEMIQQMEQGAYILRNSCSKLSTLEMGQLIQTIVNQVKYIVSLEEEEIAKEALKRRLSFEQLLQIKKEGQLPVLLIANGNIKTPKDAAYLMRKGADSLLITYEVFKERKVERLLKTLVEATLNYTNTQIILKLQISISPLNEKTYVYKR